MISCPKEVQELAGDMCPALVARIHHCHRLLTPNNKRTLVTRDERCAPAVPPRFWQSRGRAPASSLMPVTAAPTYSGAASPLIAGSVFHPFFLNLQSAPRSGPMPTTHEGARAPHC